MFIRSSNRRKWLDEVYKYEILLDANQVIQDDFRGNPHFCVNLQLTDMDSGSRLCNKLQHRAALDNTKISPSGAPFLGLGLAVDAVSCASWRVTCVCGAPYRALGPSANPDDIRGVNWELSSLMRGVDLPSPSFSNAHVWATRETTRNARRIFSEGHSSHFPCSRSEGAVTSTKPQLQSQYRHMGRFKCITTSFRKESWHVAIVIAFIVIVLIFPPGDPVRS